MHDTQIYTNLSMRSRQAWEDWNRTKGKANICFCPSILSLRQPVMIFAPAPEVGRADVYRVESIERHGEKKEKNLQLSFL